MGQLSTETPDLVELERQLAYYRRRVDELGGENVKLDISLSELRHSLRQKEAAFSLLSELQQSIGSHHEVSPIFELTVQAINRIGGMDKAVVLEPTDAAHTYRPAHAAGLHEESLVRLRSRIFHFPDDFALGAEPMLVTKSSDPTALTRELAEALDLPYFVCVPVVVEGAPIGLLLAGRAKEAKPLYPPLDQGDVDTFRAVAGLIAANVQNQRLVLLEESDRLKSQFFANVSHEFRTPLTLTLGPLEQILAGRSGEISPALRRQLDLMQRNQERLLQMINQLLDLSQLEAGTMPLRAAPTDDLNAFVSERVESFRGLAENRGIDFRLALDRELPGAELFIDREKFDQLLFNLLANALKFTERGQIELATELKRGSAELRIRDTGIGISPEDLPQIFDRFRRADAGEARDYPGSGIGLALVKEVAELHGGEVSAHSEHGRGSVFTVTIPLGSAHLDPDSVVRSTDDTQSPSRAVLPPGKAAAEVAPVDEPSFDPARRTILYVEDNPDLRAHVAELLGPEYNVVLAGNGAQGLEKARQHRPELIIADQMMPGMSGNELLGAIRQDPDLASIPVVFVTARAGMSARLESLEAGADDYLDKPFHADELLARVRNLLRARTLEREIAELSERRRIERDLHDGAQQRLVNLSLELTMAQERATVSGDEELSAMLREMEVELSGSLAELRELARGIHPALLTEAGLGPALQSLAERAPLPIRLECEPLRRFHASIEATAYFIVSEALTNLVKHSQAASARIEVREEAGELAVEVTDDGIGGADMTKGSGLAGLKNRVMAFGGQFQMESEAGRGTHITARIPCG